MRKDLLDKELEQCKENNLFFEPLHLTTKIIDQLFTGYFVKEHTEHFYDSEPEIPDEWGELLRLTLR